MRILVYRLGSIGDMVVALPALHAIRRQFPDATIALLTNEPADPRAAPADSVLPHGLIDQVIAYPLSTRDAAKLGAVRTAIRRFRPDRFFYLAAPRGTLALWRDSLFFKLCGAGTPIGFPRTADLRRCRPFEREASRLARCLGQSVPVEPERLQDWDLGLSALERAEADAIIARALGDAPSDLPLLGLCVGTKQEIKDWGEENWRQVLRALADPGHALVMIGAADERERSDRVAEGWPAPVLNFCGRLSPRLSAAVIGRAQLFLCHDSGPMHLAAAQGVRCIAVFSRKSPPCEWFPIGNRHIIFYPPHPGDTIQAIRPAQVIEAARAALAADGRVGLAQPNPAPAPR